MNRLRRNIRMGALVLLALVGVLDPLALVAGCASYTDDFSNPGTYSNYELFLNYHDPGNPTTTGYQIAGGVLTTDGGTSNNGGLFIVKDSVFSHRITDYTLECDIKMKNLDWQGVFGLIFRMDATKAWYAFQLNSTEWQVEKNFEGFTYPGDGASSPAYNLGQWIHMKSIVKGKRFLCYLNLKDGSGDRLIYDVTDPKPYVDGGVGIRTYGITKGSNLVTIDNLSVSECQGGAGHSGILEAIGITSGNASERVETVPTTDRGEPDPGAISDPTGSLTPATPGAPTPEVESVPSGEGISPDGISPGDCIPALQVSAFLFKSLKGGGTITLTTQHCGSGIDRLVIVNRAGKVIRRLRQEDHSRTALETATWDGTDEQNEKVPWGIYRIQYETDSKVEQKSLLVIP